MPRYVALLRAINVGGHNVKMEELRRQFERLGLSNVETFIASGNVLFDAKSSSVSALEHKIEAGLRTALGYEVATMVRKIGRASCRERGSGSGRGVRFKTKRKR